MNNKETVNKIYNKFLSVLLEDLNDSSKCSPGLYQVVRGVIQDNKELLDNIPSESMEAVEAKLASSVPFRFSSSKAV
jgi:hypothetical protein